MPEYRDEFRTQKFVILFVDICLVVLAYVAAFYLRYLSLPQRNWQSFLELLPWILIIALFFLAIYELYALYRKSVWDVVSKVLVCVTMMMIFTMAASFLFRQFAFPRSVIVLASIFIVLFLITWKIFWVLSIQKKRAGRVLLIGDEHEAQKVITQIKHPLLNSRSEKVRHVQPNTNLERIYELIRLVDYVLICPNLEKEKKSEIIYHAIKFNKVVYVIPTLYELLMCRANITSIDDTMVLAVRPFGLTWDQEFFKRIFDLVSSAFLLITLLPLFFIVGIVIKLEDPKGEVIYTQSRLGLYNKEFMIYKFRSMVEGAEKSSGPVLASEQDDRITKVGRFMRMTRIDELPQLWNVFLGHMSLVGPRPERPFFTKQLNKQYQTYQYRNTVRPGITGYAQVMGKYSTSVEDKLRYDLHYIRHYSFYLDMIIIFRTFLVMVDKTKSAGK